MRIVQYVPKILSPVSLLKAPGSTDFISENEYRSLEFFQLHAASCFGKEVGSFFLQAAYREPTIKTIAIAVGSLHRAFVFNKEGSTINAEDTQFTLHHYNKSIRQLLTGYPQNLFTSGNIILIACILFYCFECLQGHYRSALQHAYSGLRILKQQQMLSHGPGSQMYVPQATVMALFAILENQVLELEGQALAAELRPTILSSFRHTSLDLSPPLLSVEDMRQSFEALYNKFMRLGVELVAQALEESSGDQLAESATQVKHIREEYTRIRAALQGWSEDFERWLAQPSSAKNDLDSIAILKAWKVIVSILLRMEWPPSELTWDNYTADFALINSLASEMLGLPSSAAAIARSLLSLDFGNMSRPNPAKPSTSTFSLTLGIVTPLYICATRCRDSGIRNRAIDLLSNCKRREGMWDSELAARIAKRITTIEEGAAGIMPSAAYQPADISLPARVESLSPQFGHGREAKIRHKSSKGLDFVEETLTW